MTTASDYNSARPSCLSAARWLLACGGIVRELGAVAGVLRSLLGQRSSAERLPLVAT